MIDVSLRADRDEELETVGVRRAISQRDDGRGIGRKHDAQGDSDAEFRVWRPRKGRWRRRLKCDRRRRWPEEVPQTPPALRCVRNHDKAVTRAPPPQSGQRSLRRQSAGATRMSCGSSPPTVRRIALFTSVQFARYWVSQGQREDSFPGQSTSRSRSCSLSEPSNPSGSLNGKAWYGARSRMCALETRRLQFPSAKPQKPSS